VKTVPPGLVPDTGAEAEALIQEARRRRHRRWLAVGAAIAAVVAGAAAVIAGAGGGSRPRPPVSHGPAGSHARPAAPAQAQRLVTVSQTSLPKGNSLSLATRYRAVWVTGIGVTYQVNQANGRIARTIPTPGTFPDGCGSGIAAGAGAVWVTHGCRGIYRIDPRSGRVTASLRVPDAGDAIAVADGLVWVTNYHGDLLRIQPRTNRITGKPIRVGDGDWAMVPAAGALWVTSYGSGIVSRVDMATGAVEAFGNLNVEAAGAGSLWTPQVQRMDPATGRVIASVPVAGTGSVSGVPQVVFWKGSAWALTLQRSLTFLRIDPAANQVTGKPVPVGKPVPIAAGGGWPTAVAAGPTGLWVIDFMRNLLFHLAMRPSKP
jgi:DNA-binding beta-propeller fold protein YncE